MKSERNAAARPGGSLPMAPVPAPRMPETSAPWSGRAVRSASLLAAALLLGACTVGPDYHRPDLAIPAHYQTLDGWQRATPDAAAPKGNWWTAFQDPLLDELAPQVASANPSVATALANYDKALAELKIARSGLFPTLGLTGGVNRQDAASASGSTVLTTSRSVEAAVSWSPDLWGEVRRNVEAGRATAQAGAATAANAILSAQVALATAIIELRVTDAATALAREAVESWQESLRVVTEQDAAGTVPPSNLMSARTQVDTARANLIALGVARAQYAHAIAVLVGRNPGDLAIAPTTTLPTLPTIPVGVPSELLQRRPDIAAAERQMAAANAAIGVAEAAWYPALTLSASGGVSKAAIAGVLRASNVVWALGASVAETLIDGGARAGQVDAARASHAATVATYRGVVLAAFEGVENDLSSLQVLAEQAEVLQSAQANASRAATIARDDYEVGTVDYTTLATALAAQVSARQSLLTVQQQRLVSAVNLYGDLGGDWSSAALAAGAVGTGAAAR